MQTDKSYMKVNFVIFMFKLSPKIRTTYAHTIYFSLYVCVTLSMCTIENGIY